MELREPRPEDTDALVTLACRSWGAVEDAIDARLGDPLARLVTPSWEAHHTAVVRSVCDDPDATVVVAEDGGTIVGFVGHRLHAATPGMSAYGEVVVIAVAPEARRSGVGARLLDRAVTDLRTAGAPVIMLDTGDDPGHAPARALYEAAGFTRLPTAQYWLPG
ncbi:GNAT family N-acetyltransferase [Nitriliruptoraceae bacterium ZYF776]|nr:GNAT family N-acetyltransferase [Profundirhabdus halotolerans]